MHFKWLILGGLVTWFPLHIDCFTHIQMPKTKQNHQRPVIREYENQEEPEDLEWSHGEVAWDFPNEGLPRKPEPQQPFLVPTTTTKTLTNSMKAGERGRDRIWQFLQEVEIRATAAAISKTILEETPLLNSILLDDDTFQVQSREFETMVALFIALAVRSNKKGEIEYMRTVDVEKYTKIRKMVSLWMVSMMVVFTKNVKDAF
jgi:hypothetical protein